MKTTQNTITILDTKKIKEISGQSAKEIKNVIKLIQATDKSKVILSKFIQHDIEANKGQIILLTAQHLCTKTPANSFKNCTTLNSLSRAVKRITSDEANDMDAVKITRTDKKVHTCELLPNLKTQKEFSTFIEIEKLLSRTEGKTANNLTDKESQTLIQALGKIIS
tara:strand:- start:2963 stop:3460 length:498 start_codon:yes stop_codon:yes gene_type:complete